MFRLKVSYLFAGIVTGLILIGSFFWSLPDGKLHIVFCDVGQGDAAYIRFPDGRDMLVDGGPNDRVLGCLGKHMPFWDKHINIVVMSHPQKDHMQGLVSVFDRYTIDYFVRSDIENNSEGYQKLLDSTTKRHVAMKYVASGEHIDVGNTSLSVIWPSEQQVALMKGSSYLSDVSATGVSSSVLGAKTKIDLNDGSVVFLLRYGNFDAFFPGDADSHVEAHYAGSKLADDQVEVLKVPHHGSKTGMTEEFIKWVHPKLAIISVGKNTYGHPTQEALNQLSLIGSRVLRTDQMGDIEIVSDGRGWVVK